MSTERELLEEVRSALAQALSQWSMYANQKRYGADDVDLGDADTLEDHAYSRAILALKRLRAAADGLPEPSPANKTAFAEAPCSAPLVWSERKPDRAGWWWFGDHLAESRDEIVYVIYSDLFCEFRIWNAPDEVDYSELWDGLWAGPIPSPLDPLGRSEGAERA